MAKRRGRPPKKKKKEVKNLTTDELVALEIEKGPVSALQEQSGTNNEFSQEQLFAALEHVMHVMEQAVCPWVLTGDVAKSLKESNILSGHIEFVVREKNFVRPADSVIKEGLSDEVMGVPIKMKIIKNEYEFISHPDTSYYSGEIFKIPNQFDKYWGMKDQIS